MLVGAILLSSLLVGSSAAQTRTRPDPSKPTGPPIDLLTRAPLTLSLGEPVARILFAAPRPSLTSFTLRSGKLPIGLQLTPGGLLYGTPSEVGTFRADIAAVDINGNARFSLSILVTSEALAIAWKEAAHVEGESIAGSVEITNRLSKPADITVIIVAVNEINKAFALGYQHYQVSPGSRPQLVRFGSQLPFGKYIVHADAIAEVPIPKTIYRSRIQTQNSLVITQQ